MTRIDLCGADAPELAALLEANHREHLARYPELQGEFRAAFEGTAHCLLARESTAGGERTGGRPVGCCAVQPLKAIGVPDNSFELKRMFVLPTTRGRGLGRQLLAAAERLAAGLGAAALYLETGNRHRDAIRLYERHGFVQVPLYEPYLDDPFARCYAKGLNGGPAPGR